eukprot:337618_1
MATVSLKTHLDKIMHSATNNLPKMGDISYENAHYHEAASYYSSALLSLCQNALPQLQSYLNLNYRETVSKFIMCQYRIQCSILRNKRSECYLKLNQYEKSLTDLNWIIERTKEEYGPTQTWVIEMLPYYKKAELTRSKIFFDLGNTAMSLMDCMDCLHIFDDDTLNCSVLESIEQLKMELVAIRHPSPQTLVNIKYNEFTKKLNKFSIDGWIELKTNNNLKTLPFKQGHSIISIKDKIYCFGGTKNENGYKSLNCDVFMFYQISIHQTESKYYYKWKKLPFPNKLKYKIIDRSEKGHNWSRLVTIEKWKGNLLLIGGNVNPFRNILCFNSVNQKWFVFPIKKIYFFAAQYRLKNHASTILRNKLYVFGGDNYGDDTNLLFCLDLKKRIWTKICGTDNESIINKQLPPPRYDHIMWSDKNKGDLGSIYVGYGCYTRLDLTEKSGSCPRRLIWRFDVAENKWNVLQISGNFPARRGECGYTSISRKKQKGIVIFGGYSSSMQSLYGPEVTKTDSMLLMNATYFGDCFEFFGKTEKWIMIHSTKFPSLRALPAMCTLNNFIVVYGGYHEESENQNYVLNDLWILDKNKWQTKMKCCRKCNRSSNQYILYLCRGCRITRYCSRKCQKLHWLKHKAHCLMFL